MKRIFLLSLILAASFYCFAQVPNYVSSIELANLKIGDSKSTCVQTLGGLYPFNVLSADFNGCEVHHYMYKKPKHKFKLANLGRESLNGGVRMYNTPSDAYLLFKNGLLELVVTDIGWEDAIKLVDDLGGVRAACREEGLRGCTDELAINFDSGAVIDDGKCEYPPCGYALNPNFNAKKPISDCNSRFISIKQEVIAEETLDQCSDCDIIQKLSEGNATINVMLKMNSNGRVQFESPKKADVPSKSKSK